MRHGYLIDMDGVLCRGREMIPGADSFIAALREAGIPFLLLTNNSQRSRRDIATRLQRIGIPVDEEHIFTSAMATARFLARMKPNGTAYVIGEGGLTTALHLNGFAIVDHAPDFVVIGEGRTVTFEQLEQAVQFVAQGARLIATNLDPNCPTESGLRPGCGAIVAMIETATGRKAFSVGKPSPVMLRAARKELDLRSEETCIIGDTMETDIWGGFQLGYHTILVLSGSTQLADLAQYAFRPEKVVASVEELVAPLRQYPQRPLWLAPSGEETSLSRAPNTRPTVSAAVQGGRP
ncbi:Ribonucleotide monophosphatase NagD [bacterium HR36]|nr:Ribonucleotide monophosphatase NagD [bacterium HR36]